MYNFTCQECGEGKIQAETRRDYRTKIGGYPFVVAEAVVGVCDSCGAEVFHPEELARWASLYEESIEERELLLTAELIRETREGLGLKRGDFARLIGCTRQSVYNWERPDRHSPQLRVVDILLRLIRASMIQEDVNVLRFLQEQAEAQEVHIQISPRKYQRGLEMAPEEKFNQAFGSREPSGEVPQLV